MLWTAVGSFQELVVAVLGVTVVLSVRVPRTLEMGKLMGTQVGLLERVRTMLPLVVATAVVVVVHMVAPERHRLAALRGFLVSDRKRLALDMTRSHCLVPTVDAGIQAVGILVDAADT